MSNSTQQPSRREFIERAGATSIAMVAAAAGTSRGQPATAPTDTPLSQVPLDVAVDARDTVLRQAVAHISGVPLGGIGAGSIEIRPDGCFHDWQIFNMGRLAGDIPKDQEGGEPDASVNSLTFVLRTQQADENPKVRRLSTRADQNELYNLSWLQTVDAIEYDGRYPLAILRYVDSTLPVQLSCTIFTPIIPHDTQTSGTPGFHAIFTIRNPSSAPVNVSLMSTLRNPLAWGAEDRKLRTSITRDDETTCLTMHTAAEMQRKTTLGSIGLSVTGGEASWIVGEYRQYMSASGWWMEGSQYGRGYESYLRQFREDGKLSSLSGAADPTVLLREDNETIAKWSLAQKRDTVRLLRTYSAFDWLARRVERVAPGTLASEDGMAQFIQECKIRIERYTGKERKDNKWGDAALCSALTLAPGEEKQISFTIGWHFPHHFSSFGDEMGHQYEAWFKDAQEVNRFLAKNAGDHHMKVARFVNSMFETTLGGEMSVAWSAQLSTMVKSSWWTRNGLFAIWEGLGCCGLHTMDITYQGSFPIIALWPELQKQQMNMGAAYQRDDGRVHHFFEGSLAHVDDGYDRVDMNNQFVLLVCRDYLWTGDLAYLKKLWPNIKRAIAAMKTLDTDGDGLPDRDTRRNTYDAWNFFGTPSYIASLWLGALRAGVRLAEDLNEPDRIAEWNELLVKGSASFEAKLWNGDYYSLWVDKNDRDDCCMSDQLSGEWFTHLLGLGNVLPRERIIAALKAVYRYNFDPEHGLLNASYPKNKPARFTTFENGQAAGNWTGIEYAIASMMIDYGMVTEGYEIVRSVHRRYVRAGRVWNHIECGDHYYRAMSSWALLLSLTGFKPDMPRSTLTVSPIVVQDELRAPWALPGATGQLAINARRVAISCDTGSLELAKLRLRGMSEKATISLQGRTVKVSTSVSDGLTVFEFSDKIRIAADQSLVCTA